MSHFTVAVICDDYNEISSLLEPFEESAKNEKYLEFVDVEEECKKAYETKTKTEWYCDFSHRVNAESIIEQIKTSKNFKFVHTDVFESSKCVINNKVNIYTHVVDDTKEMHDNYRNVNTVITDVKNLSVDECKQYLGYLGLLNIRRNSKCKEEFIHRLNNLKYKEISVEYIDPPKEIPFKEIYKDLKTYIEQYEEYSFNEKYEKYGYFKNPNAKWDWYTVGGRWMGSLLIKKESEGYLGKPGAFNNTVNAAPKGFKWVDIAKISDVEFNKMFDLKKLDLLSKELEDGDIWDVLTEKIKLPQAKRLQYTMYKPQYYIEKYKNKETYINSTCNFSTYAVITPDGNWHSPGEMGWFGFSSDKYDDKIKFENDFKVNFLDPYKDKYIVIVDCHI